jgi:beta-glucosidase
MTEPSLPYLNPNLPATQRADDLVSRMTLVEKIGQMLYEAPAIERLGIPEYNWWNECLHGVGRAGVATVFPQAIGLAATWDVDLMLRVATAISDEARAKYNDWQRRGIRQIYAGLTYWSPNVNIFRDPRWGRGQETYGEDPYLTARMGVAFVRGLQGDHPRTLKLVATAKHYAVHSGPEPDRHGFDAIVDERDLRETYLPAFEALVREGMAESVMGAYNRTNGEACCASLTLLEKILRQEWGFDGYVVSDCGAIDDIWKYHGLAGNREEAAALAVKNGCELNCGETYAALLVAHRKGLIDEAALDTAVTRLFRSRIRLGMFDPPELVPFSAIPYEVVNSPEHRGLALQAARESIALLKNDGLLPLSKEIGSIAVIGPNADDLMTLLGNYNGTPAGAVTPLEGIRRAVSAKTAVYTAKGCPIADGVPNLSVIPSDCLRPAQSDGPQRGLTGAYYPVAQIEGPPAFTRLDPAVDFIWKNTTPVDGEIGGQFAVRWTGFLVPPVSGTYRLGINGHSGYQLYLDGELLVEYRGVHHALRRTKEVRLEAGRLHRLQLDYTNDGIDPWAQLVWAVPGAGEAAQALEIAAQADVVVLCLGLTPYVEGEEMPVNVEGFVGGDRTDIALPKAQQALLERVHALGKPVVLVLLGGSAIAVGWADAHIPAILQAWYPGEAGGTALADVLFGDTNPSGRLPVTVYKSVADLPPFTDYAMANRTYRYFRGEPLYPFGHGLSYTTFAYDNLRFDKAAIMADEPLVLTVDVRNTGQRAGDEVVQLYLSYPDTSPRNPIHQLRGFTRVHLAPGESKTVSFTLPAKELALVNDAGQRVVEAGEYRVSIGGRQPALTDQNGGEMTGAFLVS